MSERFNGKITLPELDSNQWWSWNRAKRGGLITAKWTGTAFSLITIGTIGLAAKQNPSILIEHPLNNLIGLAGVIGAYTATGALIDGFRPTSRLVKQQVEDFIETKNDVISTKNSITRGINYLRHIDYRSKWANFKKQAPQKAYDLLRPEISRRALDRKGQLLTESAIVGATLGGLTFGSTWIVEQGIKLSDRLFSDQSDPIVELLPIITQHPLEIIGGSTALLVALTAYPLLFHRPFTSDQTESNI